MPEAQSSASITVRNLRVARGGQSVLHDVSLEVPGGRTLAVVGASGGGKTTLLRAIAGLLPIESGRILLGDASIQDTPAAQRHCVYLYQEPLLFPHLDVFDNIAFGLRLRRMRRTLVGERVRELLDDLELSGLEHRHPQALSGGQRQRVAFGRALIVEPALLLLDEPFSNLDPDTRSNMQQLLKRVTSERSITSVFVTHDIKETLQMGERFGLLHDGTLTEYTDRAAFCADPRSGVARERTFWDQLGTEQAPDGRDSPV